MKRKCKKSGFTPLEIRVSNRGSKRFLTGFTIVELLTVLAIIALLTGILIPSLNLVRNIAKETKQKAQFATIEQALLAFRSDYGDYPPSVGLPPDYCGAQKLAEALLGQDLLGFHPGSDWLSNGSGIDKYGAIIDCYPTDQALLDASLDDRVGPYLELATANAFRLGISAPDMRDGLFNDPAPLAPNTFVICDSFGVKKVTIGQKTVRAGTPILYYKADTTSRTIEGGFPNSRIYNVLDNERLVSLVDNHEPSRYLAQEDGTYQFFYNYITEPQVSAASGRPWPYRADSYILISAGADGLYGTNDDITNFGN